MEVYLIRHTTPQLEPGLIYGRKDIPLHPDFPIELEAVRSHFNVPPDVVFSSPAMRCTALARVLHDAFCIDDRLQELDFGEWEGKTWDIVDQQALQLWMDDYVHECTPGGESLLQMHDRVNDFWKELKKSGHSKVAIVTHAGVIRLILAIERQMALTDIFSIPVAYGEVIRVTVSQMADNS